VHKNKVYQNKDVDKLFHDQGPSEPGSQTTLPNTRFRNMVLIDEGLLARFPSLASMTFLNERVPRKNLSPDMYLSIPGFQEYGKEMRREADVPKDAILRVLRLKKPKETQEQGFPCT